MIGKKPVWVPAVCCLLALAVVGASARRTAPVMSGRVENGKPVIIVDAGHGGVDGGAVASDGTVEKDINLKIALKLRDCLAAMGFSVLLTREGDYSIHDSSAGTIRQKKVSDIKNRLKMTSDHPEALFVSIHQNTYTSSKYRGSQVFYAAQNPKSRELAELLQTSLRDQLQPENTRQIKPSPKSIYLLYHMQSVGALVECGFLSNHDETQMLKSDDYQNKLAFSIACGIMDYHQMAEGG